MGYLTVSYVLRSAATGAIQPGKVVKVFPADIPLLAQQDDNTWSPHNSHPELFPSDALTAVVSFKIPWAATSRPTTARFVIAHPDGTSYVGVVPSLATADLEILVDNWNWTPVAFPGFVQIVTAQGKPGLVNRGVYSNTTQYSPGDWVTYNGGTWAALLPTIGLSPVPGATWQLQAAGGAVTSSTNANLIYAGPVSGGAATPAMRAMVDADIPSGLTGSKVSGALSNATLATSALTGTIADGQIPALSASKLTGSHTLPDGTLSTNVPLLNAGVSTFTGNLEGFLRDHGGQVTNVMHSAYGAVGDGATLDHTAIQSAINAAGVAGVVFFPPGKTFLLGAHLAPLAGQVFYGYGATLKRADAVSSPTSSSITITHGDTMGTKTVVDGSVFRVGQEVSLVLSSTTYDINNHKITAINGNVLTLSGSANLVVGGVTGGTATGVWTVYSGAFGQVVSQVDDIKILGLTLNGNRQNNAVFQHWEIHQEISFNASNRSTIKDCYAYDAPSEGFEVVGSNNLVEGNKVLNCQGNGMHLASPVDPGGNIKVIGNYVENCNLSGTATGHSNGCIIASSPLTNTVVTGNVVINGIAGFEFHTDTVQGLVCTGNVVKNCATYAFDVVASTASPGRFIFSNNLVYSSGPVNLNLTVGSAPLGPNRIIIAGNYLEDTVLNLAGTQNCQLVNNLVFNSGTSATLCTIANAQYLSVIGNRFVGGNGGIFASGAPTRDLLISANAFVDNNQIGLTIASSCGGPNLRVSDNTFKASASMSATHTSLNASASFLTVSGNDIENLATSGSGIVLGGGTTSTTSGNLCQGNTIRMANATFRPAITIGAAANNAVVTNNRYFGTVSNAGTNTSFGTNYKSDGGGLDMSLPTTTVYTTLANTIAPASGVPLTLAPAVSTLGLAIKAPASGSTDLQQWQDNSGAAKSGIKSDWSIYAPSAAFTNKVAGAFWSGNFTQVGSSYNSVVLADTPSMYWRLDDTAGPVADASGNGKTGTLAGTVTLGAAGLTQDQDTAVSFPGFTSPASTITGPATGIANNATFSVECLVNLTDYSYNNAGAGQNSQYIWVSSNGATEKTALKWVAPSAGTAFSNKFGVNTATADTNTLYSAGTYLAGSVYHVLYVWDASASTEYLYVNGVLDTSRVTPPVTPSLSLPLVIGSRTNGFSANFPSPAQGTIDEVAVYTTAVSSARAAVHAAAVSTVIPKALVYGVGANYTGDMQSLVVGANSWRVDNTGILQAGTVPSARISGGVAPTGAASGDLGGTFPSPTVTNLSNVSNASLGTSAIAALAVTDAKVNDLAATKLTGLLADARLSSNVPLKNAANTFTLGQTIAPTSGTALTVTPFTNTAGVAIQTSGTATALSAAASTGAAASFTGDRGTSLQLTQTGNLTSNDAGTGILFTRSFGTPGGFTYSGITFGVNDSAAAPSGSTPPYSTADLARFQVGNVSRLQLTNPGLLTFNNYSSPIAPSAFVDNGAGNVDSGSHTWAVVYSDGTMTTLTGTTAAYDTTGGGAGARSVSFTIPLGPNGVTARQIARSKVGTSTPLYRVDGVGTNSLVSDNTTTTFTDNVADASLVTPFYAAQQLKGRINAMGPLTVGSQGTAAITATAIGGTVATLTQGGQIVANSSSPVLTLTRNAPTGGFGFTHTANMLTVNDVAAGTAQSSGNLFQTQVNGASRLTNDLTGNLTLSAWAVPTAPTAALAAGGSLTIATNYQYAITFLNGNGETTRGALSIAQVPTSGNQTITLNPVPTGPQGTLSRNVYRTTDGGTTWVKFTTGLSDNTTPTFTDTGANATTATSPPTFNQAGGNLTVGSALFTTQRGIISTGSAPTSPNIIGFQWNVTGSKYGALGGGGGGNIFSFDNTGFFGIEAASSFSTVGAASALPLKMFANGNTIFQGTAAFGTSDTSALLSVLSNVTSNVALLVRGKASQTADLFQAQDSTPTTQLSVTNTGTGGAPVWALKFNDAVNIVAGTTTGTQIGTATTQKFGHWGKTPISQPGAITSPNTQTASYVQADVQSLKTAIDAIRTVLSNLGLTA